MHAIFAGFDGPCRSQTPTLHGISIAQEEPEWVEMRSLPCTRHLLYPKSLQLFYFYLFQTPSLRTSLEFLFSISIFICAIFFLFFFFFINPFLLFWHRRNSIRNQSAPLDFSFAVEKYETLFASIALSSFPRPKFSLFKKKKQPIRIIYFL